MCFMYLLYNYTYNKMQLLLQTSRGNIIYFHSAYMVILQSTNLNTIDCNILQDHFYYHHP